MNVTEPNASLLRATVKFRLVIPYVKSLRADFCGVDTVQKDDVLCSDNETKANLLN